MKPSYYQYGLCVIVVAIFYTNIPLYVYENHGWQHLEAPKHWVMLLCLFSLPVLIKGRTLVDVLKAPVAIWCLGYAWMTVLWFLPSLQSETTWQEVRNRFFTIIQILAYLGVFVRPDATRLARQTLVGAVLFGVTLNIYELFVPLSFSPVIGRSAGFYMLPTLAGEALVLGMILGVTVLKPRYRGPFVLLTGLGVLTTFSRSGILAWVIAVGGLMLGRGVSVKDFVLPICLGFVVGSLVILPRLDQLLTTWERTGVLNANVIERLEWFSDPSGVSDYSSWERKHVAQQAWEKIAQRPFFGQGTGSFHLAGVLPHNQHLSFMLDHGLIGVAVLPLLILMTVWDVRGETKHVALVFAGVLMLMSFFSHTILNTQANIVLISLMAAMAAESCQHGNVRTIMEEEEFAGPVGKFART